MAFAGCVQLERVALSQGLKEIGYSAFERCVQLKAIDLPDGFVLLDRMAFLDCAQLAEIRFPDSLCTVGRDALRGTAWLDLQPEGVIYAGKLALFAKGALTQVEIAPGTEKVCVDAFRNCSSLANVLLPESLVELEDRAFQNCRKLKQIVIPRHVARIGYRAFHECGKLQVLLECDAVHFGRDCFAADTTMRLTRLDPAQLPKPLQQSAILAFCDDCSNRVPLEDTFYQHCLRYIRSRRKQLYAVAMEHWNLLQLMLREQVILLEDVDTILDVMLEKSQAEAAAALLQYKQQLTDATADNMTLDGWDDLELSWDLPASSWRAEDPARDWGYKQNWDGTLTLRLYRGRALEVTVPGQINGQLVTAIAAAACSPERYGIKRETMAHRRQIRSVTVQEGITRIGNHAFAGCESLMCVTLPESVVEISYEAFRDCKRLQAISIPQSVERIGRSAFAGCTQLVEIHLPRGVQVADDAFAGCPGEPMIE